MKRLYAGISWAFQRLEANFVAGINEEKIKGKNVAMKYQTNDIVKPHMKMEDSELTKKLTCTLMFFELF